MKRLRSDHSSTITHQQYEVSRKYVPQEKMESTLHSSINMEADPYLCLVDAVQQKATNIATIGRIPYMH